MKRTTKPLKVEPEELANKIATEAVKRAKKAVDKSIKKTVNEAISKGVAEVKKATKATEETAQAVKDFVDAVPLKLKRPARVRVPHTKEGGIDWSKFLKDGVVLTARPEGMPYHIYKQLLFEQKWKLKMRKR